MPAKGSIKRTHCRIDGCPNPPHVYPSGARSAYCKDHIRLRKGKSRGKENVTYPMECVLRRLRAALEQDHPFLLLDPKVETDFDERTLNTLEDRDWIVAGDKHQPYYRITKRGLNILAKCDVPVLRRDGICIRCGERPRHVNGSGKTESYCYECERARCNEKEARLRRIPPKKPCRHCKAAPRHQYQPSGTWSDFCADCDRMLRGRRKHRSQSEYREQIRQGLRPVPVCASCKAKPVVLCENSVAHYCADCRPVMTRRWKVKRLHARYLQTKAAA